MFLRTTVRRRCGQASIGATCFSRGDALGRFFVVGTRFGRGPAAHGNAANNHFETLLLARDQESIVDMNHSRRLHAIAIHMHKAALHRVRCKRAALEEPRKPQPFINADPARFSVRTHELHYTRAHYCQRMRDASQL